MEIKSKKENSNVIEGDQIAPKDKNEIEGKSAKETTTEITDKFSAVFKSIASAIATSDSEISDQEYDKRTEPAETKEGPNIRTQQDGNTKQPLIQSTIDSVVVTEKANPKDDISEIKDKLDILIGRMQISTTDSTAEEKFMEPRKWTSAFEAMRDAKCLTEIGGTGIEFYSSDLDGGTLRCEVCMKSCAKITLPCAKWILQKSILLLPTDKSMQAIPSQQASL